MTRLVRLAVAAVWSGKTFWEGHRQSRSAATVMRQQFLNSPDCTQYAEIANISPGRNATVREDHAKVANATMILRRAIVLSRTQSAHAARTTNKHHHAKR